MDIAIQEIEEIAEPSATYRTTADSALLHAWSLFIALDDKSNHQKNSHRRVRFGVIIFVFLTSLLAVLTTSITADTPDLLKNLLTIALVALPITTAGLMSYGLQFTPTLAWILYRFSSESIRKEIYLYRMEAAQYQDLSLEDQQKALITAVSKACDVIKDLESLVPFLQKHRTNEYLVENVKNRTDKNPDPNASAPEIPRLHRILRGITRVPVIGFIISDFVAYLLGEDYKEDHITAYDLLEAELSENQLTGDDGFSPLTTDQYILWRALPQRNWYVTRFNRDYAKFRSSRIVILVLGGIGSILAAGGTTTQLYIVVSTALVVAFSTYVQFRMYGQTYTNYHRSAQDIDSAIANWLIIRKGSQQEAEQVSTLVSDIEAVFQQERNVWSKIAIQVQTAAEDALTKRVDELTRQSEQTEDEDAA